MAAKSAGQAVYSCERVREVEVGGLEEAVVGVEVVEEGWRRGGGHC